MSHVEGAMRQVEINSAYERGFKEGQRVGTTQAEKTVAAIVIAVGGKVEIPQSILVQIGPETTFSYQQDEMRQMTIVEASL